MKSSKPLFCSIALLLGATFAPLGWADDMPTVKVDPKPLPQVTGTLTTFAPVVEKVAPSVVTIATSKMVSQAKNPYLNDPLFRRFFGIPEDGQEPGDEAPRGRGGKK